MFFVLTARCPYCQKQRNPRDILEQPGGIRICVECEQKHLEALEALSTKKFDGSCSECGKTAEQLGRADLDMAVHYENGKYRLLCLACNLVYTPKRKELYQGTEFGAEL